MSGSEKSLPLIFLHFSRHLITLIDAYRDRFWGETGAALTRKPRVIDSNSQSDLLILFINNHNGRLKPASFLTVKTRLGNDNDLVPYHR